MSSIGSSSSISKLAFHLKEKTHARVFSHICFHSLIDSVDWGYDEGRSHEKSSGKLFAISEM